VAVAIYPHQEVIWAWLSPDLCIKIGKVIEPEFDANEVLRVLVPWVPTPATLPSVGQVSAGRILGATLAMSQVYCRPRIEVQAATGSRGAIAELVTSHLSRAPAITPTQVDATVPLGDASLSDDTQTPETLTWLVMNAERLAGFNLQTAT
jgi:hypothetical protein